MFSKLFVKIKMKKKVNNQFPKIMRQPHAYDCSLLVGFFELGMPFISDYKLQ